MTNLCRPLKFLFVAATTYEEKHRVEAEANDENYDRDADRPNGRQFA